MGYGRYRCFTNILLNSPLPVPPRGKALGSENQNRIPFFERGMEFLLPPYYQMLTFIPMEAIETKNYTWEEFVKDNPKSNINDKKYIYRGQTNGEIINNEGKTEFVEWPIISSFNRQVKSEQLSFDKFIFQQVSFIPTNKYNNYKIVRERKLSEANTISQIYFLQHYGIPTCFVDFTFHPLIALYFAISDMSMQSGGKYTIDGFCNDYPDDYYFTIYKIQIEEFRELLKIQNLKHLDLKIFVEYDDYRIDIDYDYHGHFALGA
jgi:hypothetical protein